MKVISYSIPKQEGQGDPLTETMSSESNFDQNAILLHSISRDANHINYIIPSVSHNPVKQTEKPKNSTKDCTLCIVFQMKQKEKYLTSTQICHH